MITSAPSFFMMRSAEIVISWMIVASKISDFPRFFERYWQTAEGVIPSFSAACRWLSPYCLIMVSASSFRIVGMPFQSMYSQGVRRIEEKHLFSIYN